MRPSADSANGLGPSPGADQSQGFMNAVITLLHITSSFLTASTAFFLASWRIVFAPGVRIEALGIVVCG